MRFLRTNGIARLETAPRALFRGKLTRTFVRERNGRGRKRAVSILHTRTAPRRARGRYEPRCLSHSSWAKVNGWRIRRGTVDGSIHGARRPVHHGICPACRGRAHKRGRESSVLHWYSVSIQRRKAWPSRHC